MKDIIKPENFSIDSFILENRNKLDESLVSLRLIKVVDDFLVDNKITKRDFAKKIDCSESYISQMMSGSKKFNVQFINKFEKTFNVMIRFDLHKNESKGKMEVEDTKKELSFSFSSNSSIKIESDVIDLIEHQGVYSVNNTVEFSSIVYSEKYSEYGN